MENLSVQDSGVAKEADELPLDKRVCRRFMTSVRLHPGHEISPFGSLAPSICNPAQKNTLFRIAVIRMGHGDCLQTAATIYREPLPVIFI
jgi:hypothetical protein